MDEKKFGGLLGLAVRAGQTKLGAGPALDTLRADRAGLILLDEDASENAGKRFRDACRFHQVPLCVLPAGMIGRCTGRGNAMAAALLKGGMAETLLGLCRSDIMINE